MIKFALWSWKGQRFYPDVQRFSGRYGRGMEADLPAVDYGHFQCVSAPVKVG